MNTTHRIMINSTMYTASSTHYSCYKRLYINISSSLQFYQHLHDEYSEIWTQLFVYIIMSCADLFNMHAHKTKHVFSVVCVFVLQFIFMAKYSFCQRLEITLSCSETTSVRRGPTRNIIFYLRSRFFVNIPSVVCTLRARMFHETYLNISLRSPHAALGLS